MSTSSKDPAAAPIALAFSGGLDTSYLVPKLAEESGRPVLAVTADTGGLGAEAAADLERRALALGAAAFRLVDVKAEFFDRVLRFLIAGNVRRGATYPISVGAERALQAEAVARVARALGATAVAHGSTAAGNDQVRFEVALRAAAPELEILAPIRDHPVSRAEEVAYLELHHLPVPPHGAAYSVNRGLWGTTIGGRETLTSETPLPESAWVVTHGAFDAARAPERHTLDFERGVPVAWDDERLAPVPLLELLEVTAGRFGIGRGIHLGETILGIKGRVAFEAPAAEIILTAHRELEKLVLTGRQLRAKEGVAALYADLVHEGQMLEPVGRDLEAFLGSSQGRVTGRVDLLLRAGFLFVEGVASPYSLMKASRGAYGESAGEWTGADARGFSRIAALAGGARRTRRRRRRGGGDVNSVILDKIASVTRNCGLKREVRVAAEIPCEEGVVVAVRVLNDKSTYNQLELPSGRMAQVKRGDVVAGVLGHRHALFGYSGRLPERLAAGDRVHLLNLGGVLGLCESVNPDLGRPFDCEVLGAVLEFPFLGERIGRPARIVARAARRRARARCSRRARGGAGRHLHERGQDRRGVRDRARAQPPRRDARRLQGDRRLRCAATCWRWRMPARAGPRSSPISASSRRPARTPIGSPACCSRASPPSVPTPSWSSSETACSAPTASTRFSRTASSLHRSPRSCSPRTIRWRPGAASDCCASATNSSRSPSPDPRPTTPSAPR